MVKYRHITSPTRIMLEPYVRAISVRLTTEQRDTDSMQIAADPVTIRATADYPTQSLRTEASNEVDVLRRSETMIILKDIRYARKPEMILINS
jgi:hypothetical protein